MRKTHLALGLFLLFFLLEFTVPAMIPTTPLTAEGNPELETTTIASSFQPQNNLIVIPSEAGAPPVPDNPQGTGRETLVEWWDTNYDYRREITIIEPDIASRTMEPVHVYLTFSGDVARENIIAVAYWDLMTWHEVPSQVWNTTTHTTGPTTFYDSLTICFLVNITLNHQEVFYIYYDDDYSVAPTYIDQITAIPANGPINDDSTMPWVYSDVTSTNYTNVDIVYIRSAATSSEHAAILLTDMLRGGSDWGGPCCGLIAVRYGDTDALDTNNGTGSGTNLQYMLLGEFALDPEGVDSTTGSGSTIFNRANVAPDNPAEAWIAGAGVWIIEDGSLFTRIKIITSDGGYCNQNSPWCNQTSDTVNRGNNGAAGFLNYTITYTFYWHGDSALVNVILEITANPQWQNTQCHVKNYGDWPHIMTFTCGSGTPGTIDAVQNRKAWIGSKYGLYNESVDGRRRDFPIEPWMVWYDDSGEAGYDGTQHPTLGLIAKVNPVGWEVLSLAVLNMGDNTMLEQILREGHQGDLFIMPTGETFTYDYTVFTSAYGTNYTDVRSLTFQINNPITIELGEQELFRHNILNCTTKDVEGSNISNINVYIYNSSMDLVQSGPTVNANVTFLKLEDGLYTIISNYTLLSTYGGSVTFLVNTTQITLNHTTQRGWQQTIHCQLSDTTVHVVDWYTNNNLVTFAEIFLDNATTGKPVFALNATLPTGTASTYLLPGLYDVNIRYINQFRVHNQTTPISVSDTTSTNVPIGVVATEHPTELQLVRPSTIPYIEVGYNTTTQFVVQYWDLVAGAPIDATLTSIPYVANWTLSNSTHSNVDSGTLNPIGGEPGNYSVTFNAAGYLVNETYQLRILLDVNAPVDYWQAFLSISIVIRGREVQIIPEYQSYGVFWNDSITLTVYLNDTATNQPITGAAPQFFGIGFSGILQPNGTDGWYATTFRVEAITVGTYTITIRAQIAAYEDATAQVLLYVAPQPTTAALIDAYTADQAGLSNNSITDFSTLQVPINDLLILTFNYSGMWNQLIHNATAQISYQVGFQSIEYIGNGLYRVIINSSTVPIGSYSAAAGFSGQNYEISILSFTIEVTLIPTDLFLLNPILDTDFHELNVGDLFRIRVNFTDLAHFTYISGAVLTLDIPGVTLGPILMQEVEPGVYEAIGLSVLFEGVWELNIVASKTNYAPATFQLQLIVQVPEFSRNIITWGLIAALIGIIILIAWVAYTRVFAIPWLVRKMRKMSTTLGKGKMTKLSGRDQRRISDRLDQMGDIMEDAYGNVNIAFVTSAVPIALSVDEREAEEVDIWHELDQLEGLGRDQKLELFEEMKRIPAKDRIWFLEDLKHQMADGTRFKRAPALPPEGLLDKTAEEQIIQARLDAIPTLSEREKKTLFKQISSLPPEDREEVFETLKDQYETPSEEEE